MCVISYSIQEMCPKVKHAPRYIAVFSTQANTYASYFVNRDKYFIHDKYFIRDYDLDLDEWKMSEA